MKFSVKKSDILDVLSKVQGITGRKSNLAITTSVLIRVSDSRLQLVATDLETGFEGEYPAVVESEGTVAINSRKLFEIVRDFPSDDILLDEVDNHWVKIGNENVEYHIMGMNPDDFPDIPFIEEVEFYEFDSLALKKMIEKTSVIVGATDDKRAHIVGNFLERVDDGGTCAVRMVSTDGSRLATVDIAYDSGEQPPFAPGILVPKKGLTDVGKFLSTEGTVKLGLKDNKLIFKKKTETIIIRLLEGDFPDYRGIVVRDESGHHLKLDKSMFLMMLKRMSILSSEDYRGVIFNFADDKLVINSTNPDIGESKEDMDIDFTGEPIQVAFNPKFFIDSLHVIEDDVIILDIIDEERPCLVMGETDQSYLSVIMPMRI